MELLNDWLEQASDEQIAAALADFDEVGYETIVHFYADRDDDLYDILGQEPLDPHVNERHLEAWTARHRPHLLSPCQQ